MGRWIAWQHLIAGSPVSQSLGQLMEALWRLAGAEAADRMPCADEPMRGSRHEPGRQAWHPFPQHGVPGRFSQGAVEKGDPISEATGIAQGCLPALRGDRALGPRAVLEALLIAF